MGDVRLAVQKSLKAGLDLTDNGGLAVAATSTYMVANDGRTFLHFKKTAAVIATMIWYFIEGSNPSIRFRP